MRLSCIALAASVVTALSLSGCAPASTTAAGPVGETSTARCFRTDGVHNFRVDRQTDLYIRSLRDDVFLINTSGGCADLASATTIAVTSTMGGSDTVCVGDPVHVVVPGSSMGPGSCRAFVTKSLNAEEVAALPDRVRP